MTRLFRRTPARPLSTAISSLLLSGCLIGAIALPVALSLTPTVRAQNSTDQTADDLYYTFYGRQIPLRSRTDVVAVEFRPVTGGTRSRGTMPLYLQLQQDLQSGTPGLNGTR